MLVLHVVSNNGVGGVERHVQTLAAAQRALGTRVEILCPARDHFVTEAESLGLSVHIDPALAPGTDAGDTALAAARSAFLRHLRRLTPDVVHAHSRRAGTVAMASAISLGIPAVYTHHSLDVSPFLQAEHVLGRRYPIVAVSTASATLLRQRLGPDADVRVVPNGIPADSPPMQTHDLPPRPSLAVVGRLTPEKGVDQAIIALRHLVDHQGAEQAPALHIFGRGTEERTLRLLCQHLDLTGRVHFHGSRPGVLAIRLPVNALVIPSRSESAPLVLLEAMRSRIPVVATDVGGIGDVLPSDRYGVVVPAGSPEELARGILPVLADPERAASRADAAHERFIDEFTADRMALRTLDLYKETLHA
ncbi:glycosyltransferase family 4 protein [Catenulispora sp. NL8]|uniref:Glycosyltransferase family 4 protein n=1 Tax=Catenulispora pinistramenti TaxID=2705254 RepID=A0ABS5L243_9ACTN|nr:glycosyltransferase family 4 protein [Catenulispora pinistramenti]MBS2552408.1 glycosyltransferase family 4 protein [Catenulispora pinistramenti]